VSYETYNVTPSDVLGSVGFADVTAQSRAKPGPDIVGKFIRRYASRLHIAIAASGGETAPTEGSADWDARRDVLVSRCAAAWYVAKERAESEYAAILRADFDNFLEELKTSPGRRSRAGHSTSKTAGGSTDAASSVELFVVGSVDKRTSFN